MYTDADKRAVAKAREILSSAREELNRADGKASLLLAAGGIGISPVLSALLSKQWTPMKLTGDVRWLWWLALAATLVGFLALGTAVFPRVRVGGSERPKTISYFSDVVRVPQSEIQAILEREPFNETAAIYDQLWQVSRIVSRKYSAIRIALTAFAVAIAAAGLLTVLS